MQSAASQRGNERIFHLAGADLAHCDFCFPSLRGQTMEPNESLPLIFPSSFSAIVLYQNRTQPLRSWSGSSWAPWWQIQRRLLRRESTHYKKLMCLLVNVLWICKVRTQVDYHNYYFFYCLASNLSKCQCWGTSNGLTWPRILWEKKYCYSNLDFFPSWSWFEVNITRCLLWPCEERHGSWVHPPSRLSHLITRLPPIYSWPTWNH